MSSGVRRLSAAALVIMGALALSAPAAQAGAIADAADCGAQHSLGQPFWPWVDSASYALSPDGGVEAGAAGWSLEGAAATVAGNERYNVGDAGDARSLRIPSGSSATSAPMCVGLQWPTIRLFARASGTNLPSLLRVEVVVDDALSGRPRAVLIGLALPSADWRPTAAMLTIVNNLGALTEGGMLPVAFKFTPFGSGTWQVDDLYVDPWRGP